MIDRNPRGGENADGAEGFGAGQPDGSQFEGGQFDNKLRADLSAWAAQIDPPAPNVQALKARPGQGRSLVRRWAVPAGAAGLVAAAAVAAAIVVPSAKDASTVSPATGGKAGTPDEVICVTSLADKSLSPNEVWVAADGASAAPTPAASDQAPSTPAANIQAPPTQAPPPAGVVASAGGADGPGGAAAYGQASAPPSSVTARRSGEAERLQPGNTPAATAPAEAEAVATGASAGIPLDAMVSCGVSGSGLATILAPAPGGSSVAPISAGSAAKVAPMSPVGPVIKHVETAPQADPPGRTSSSGANDRSSMFAGYLAGTLAQARQLPGLASLRAGAVKVKGKPATAAEWTASGPWPDVSGPQRCVLWQQEPQRVAAFCAQAARADQLPAFSTLATRATTAFDDLLVSVTEVRAPTPAPVPTK